MFLQKPKPKNGNLSNFIANVKSEGLMRTSRYAVTMGTPKALSSNMVDMRKLLLYCADISLPGVTLTTNQARVFGEAREMPYEKMFDNINMTFYVDNNMQVKLFFDRWMDSIQNPYTRTFNYYDQYITDITVDVEDLKDRKRYQVQLFECYPKSIGQISMGYEQKDVMKLQVSMNYKNWRSTPFGTPKDEKESPFSRFFQTPTINGYEIPGLSSKPESVPTDYVSDFSKFQSEFNTSEISNITSGVGF